MSTQEGGGFPARHLSEVISCLEDCELALKRARDIVNSMILALKIQQLLQEVGNETASTVKVEPNVDNATVQGGGSGTGPILSERIMSLLESEVRPGREISCTAEANPEQPTPTQNKNETPSQPAKQRNKRTEEQRFVRRERRRRAKDRKRARLEAASSKIQEIPRLPLQRGPTIGTAANVAPLPFNRLDMPPPPNAGAWLDEFGEHLYQVAYGVEPMHYFTSETPDPAPHHSQHNFYFQTMPPGLGGEAELEDGEIYS